MSRSVSLTLPGVFALTAIGISTVPTPFSGMWSLNASTRLGVSETTEPTGESSDATTELSFKNSIDFQSQSPSSPTSNCGASGYPSSYHKMKESTEGVTVLSVVAKMIE